MDILNKTIEHYETKKGLLSLICVLLSVNMFAQQNITEIDSSIEVIGKISPPFPDMSGIAVSSDNRVFLSFPRHADNHSMFALAELINGEPIPFPSKDFVYPSSKPYNEWLVSPHGIYMDNNDVLWVLDDGKRAGVQNIPLGAAKVVAIDIKTGQLVYSLIIDHPTLSSDSHYNDLRVDLVHGEKGTVYITNSGFGERYSIIVIDVASGRVREVLLNHATTSPDPEFMTFLEGQPHTYDFSKQTFPNGGADGIAISADNQTLYWTNISGRKLHSLKTSILTDFSVSNQEIAKAVKYEGEHPACDGLAEDEYGNIYFGSFEQQALIKRNSIGKYSLLAHDKDNFVWPDGLAYRNGYLYVTLGQWNRLPGFNGGKDLRKPPFLVIRTKVN